MTRQNPSFIAAAPRGISVNKLLRDTYLLLSATLLFSALMAGVALVRGVSYFNPLLALVGMIGLYMLTIALRESKLGILAVFAFTGFMGYTIGPALNYYLTSFSNGEALVLTALGGTGIIFLSLSFYAITTKKNFDYLAAFITVGLVVAILAGTVALFVNVPILSLVISAAFVLLCSAMILFQTSLIVRGGERNAIMATISLYVALLNLFLSLLQLLSVFAGRR